jgi:hypothetical protein
LIFADAAVMQNRILAIPFATEAKATARVLRSTPFPKAAAGVLKSFIMWGKNQLCFFLGGFIQIRLPAKNILCLFLSGFFFIFWL